MKIGDLTIERGILLAPMEDVTDLPFRLICKEMGADLMYTEFVNSDGLMRGNAKTRKKMTFLEHERPIGIQIYGGNVDAMGGAAKEAESFQPDLIDINAGCWVRDVAMRGAGAGLLRDLAAAGTTRDRGGECRAHARDTQDAAGMGCELHPHRRRGEDVRAGRHQGAHRPLPHPRPGAQGRRGLLLDPAHQGSGLHSRSS